MTRRIRLVRATLGYEGGLVLHTATSGPVPTLDEIHLVLEQDGALAALGATRTNIGYLTGLAEGEIERAVLDTARAFDWEAPFSSWIGEIDDRWPGLIAPARMLFEMAAQDGAARETGVSVAGRLGASGLLPQRGRGTARRAVEGAPHPLRSQASVEHAAPLHHAAGFAGPHDPAPPVGEETVATATNQTLFWQDDASLLRRAEAYVARGFRDLKLRIGIADFADDLRRLTLLRDRFGADLTLSADANGRWTATEAPARLDALGRIGLAYIEQPLPAENWHDTARISAASPVPIMLDEALGSMAAVRRLAETRAAPLAHLKLAKLGGLDRMMEAAGLLSAAGIGIMVGQMNEGAISTAAAAHAALAIDAPLRELYGADGITGDAARPALRYAAGQLHLPAGPGFGLTGYAIGADTPLLLDITV